MGAPRISGRGGGGGGGQDLGRGGAISQLNMTAGGGGGGGGVLSTFDRSADIFSQWGGMEGVRGWDWIPRPGSDNWNMY